MVAQAEKHLKTLAADNSEEIKVIDPVTSEVIGAIPVFTSEMLAQAAARARAAQPAWAERPVKDRCKLLRRFADLLISHQEDLITIIRRESGKSRGGALGEIIYTASIADYYARHSAKWLKPEKRRGLAPLLYSARVHRLPLGVVGNISPWNYPLVLPVVDMIPALIAGNAAIVKPSEVTPYSALEARRLMIEAGVPEDIFQIVTGDGRTGQSLIDYVDFIMLTGSTATGRKVALRAAERLIPYSLELGGNDVLIVLKDADIDKAAACAVSAGFENGGQLCMSVERVIVEEPVYEEFIAAMQKWHSKLVIGKENSLKTHVGSMTNQREMERTRRHIEDALAKGGRLIAGGKPLPELGPLFHEATIIADATPEMEAMREETFGPVVMVTKAKDAAEAVRIANDCAYGLSSSLWSRDTKRAEQLALRIESGDVNINTAIANFGTPSMEFGGMKNSGIGRRNGKQGLYKYTRTLSIVIDNFPQTPDAPSIYTGRILAMLKLMRRVQKYLPFLAP